MIFKSIAEFGGQVLLNFCRTVTQGTLLSLVARLPLLPRSMKPCISEPVLCKRGVLGANWIQTTSDDA